jgi:hypothetical protein
VTREKVGWTPLSIGWAVMGCPLKRTEDLRFTTKVDGDGHRPRYR